VKKPRREINWPMALWRRRWWIVPFIVLGTIVSLVMFSRMTRQYRASATVVLIPQSISDQIYARARSIPQTRLKQIKAEVSSTAFLEKVAEVMRSQSLEVPKRVQALGRAVEVEEIDLETFLFAAVHPDPELAAQRANIFAKVFVEFSRGRKVQGAEDSSEFLEDDIDRLGALVNSRKDELANYQAEHRGSLPSDRDAIRAEQSFLRQRIGDLEGRIQARKDERRERLALLQGAPPGGAPGAGPGRVPGVTVSDDPRRARLRDLEGRLADARLRYTAQHPEVLRLQQSVTDLQADIAARPLLPQVAGVAGQDGGDDNLRQYLRLEIERLEGEITGLTTQREQAQRQIASLEERIQASFVRQAEMDQITQGISILESRLNKNQDRMQGLMTEREVLERGMDERYEMRREATVPLLPFRPDLMQLLLIGCGGGTAVGLALALGRELLDQAVWSGDDIEDLLGVEVLAVIPNMDKLGRRRPSPPPARGERRPAAGAGRG